MCSNITFIEEVTLKVGHIGIPLEFQHPGGGRRLESTGIIWGYIPNQPKVTS
jgi:hypothetical protein